MLRKKLSSCVGGVLLSDSPEIVPEFITRSTSLHAVGSMSLETSNPSYIFRRKPSITSGENTASGGVELLIGEHEAQGQP